MNSKSFVILYLYKWKTESGKNMIMINKNYFQ